MYTMYVRNPAGFGTSAGQFEVTGSSSPILVNWRLYVGPLNQGGTVYSDWFPPTSFNINDQFNIITLNGATETVQVAIGSNASIAAYQVVNGYINGSFNYTPVDGQIKFKLIRPLSNGANLGTAHRNQVKLGGVTIHYRNRNGSTGAYNPYFDDWVYNQAYTVSGDWMIFTTGQLFSNGTQAILDLEAVTLSQ
jgi:hypothetical protein